MIQRWTIANGLGGVFLAYALWSATENHWFLIYLALAYAYGFIIPPRVVWLITCALLSVGLFVTLGGWYIGIFSPAGLFGNLNYLGVAFAPAFIAALAYQIPLFLPVAAVGLWWSQCRAAIVAAGICWMAMLWPRYRITILALTAAALTLFMVQKDPASSYLTRIGIWQDTTERLSLFGVGWSDYMPHWQSWPVHRNMTLLIAPHAYNDFLELLFLLGIGAIPLFLLIILALDASTTDRAILGCFLLLGLTYFPFFIPGVAHVFAFTLGSAIRQTLPEGDYYGSMAPDAEALR